ncbi:hypothetical protein [Actinocrispum wychmicini]|uniref:Intracellular septation protein A n=1 Tax=Actinocrispum wychmicini TaxID=1213861 RepID=A0A4R2JZ82_9PSEU|nr:hypothetical protein [Actinocrispum wychmicini]TCO64602.1 hypothetical protein EV192_101379 [Actinocrispum wychmicini]
MIGYVKTFAPWIAFAVLSTSGEYRWGALAGFALALLLLAMDRRKGKQWDALIIESSSAVFFGALAVASLTISPAPLGDYGPSVAAAWLALTAWGSLAIRRPFTLGIARTMVPEQFHSHPMFYRTNAIITAAWAVGFTVEVGLLLLLEAVAPHATAALVAVKIGAFVLPALFTIRYRQIVRARQEATR